MKLFDSKYSFNAKILYYHQAFHSVWSVSRQPVTKKKKRLLLYEILVMVMATVQPQKVVTWILTGMYGWCLHYCLFCPYLFWTHLFGITAVLRNRNLLWATDIMSHDTLGNEGQQFLQLTLYCVTFFTVIRIIRMNVVGSRHWAVFFMLLTKGLCQL